MIKYQPDTEHELYGEKIGRSYTEALSEKVIFMLSLCSDIGYSGISEI